MGEHSGLALGLVLAAALLHATWNALVKNASEPVLMMGMIAVGHLIPGALMAFYAPAPNPESWIYIAASTFIHWGYYGFLLAAYKHGDLSVVYPVARGIAPVLVALGAWAGAGETLAPQAWAGIGLVSVAILMLGVHSQRRAPNKVSVAFALLTGLTISAYSVADGLGVRASQSPYGYIGWLFLCEGFFIVYVLCIERRKLLLQPFRTYATGFAGGLISQAAYGLVIYAALLAPLGAISAVRESSVIIASLIGILLFNERPWGPRIASAVVVAAGVLLIAFVGRS